VKLSTLLRRLGLAELARRAGVSPATIRRWLRHGPSASGQDILGGIAARHRRSVKSHKTRVAHQREAFRDRLPVPVSPDLKPHRPTLGQFDDPMDLVPDRPPVETEAQLHRDAAREGHDIEGDINTDTYEGSSHWVTVGAPVVEVDQQYVIDTAMDFQRQAGHTWLQVVFLFYRYIPFNPLYKGEALIEKWQGKWKPWWESTAILDSEYGITDGVTRCMDLARFSAESRLIWFEGFKVRTMNMKPDAPKDWRDRELRRARA
jgi:hypothetical protein